MTITYSRRNMGFVASSSFLHERTMAARCVEIWHIGFLDVYF